MLRQRDGDFRRGAQRRGRGGITTCCSSMSALGTSEILTPFCSTLATSVPATWRCLSSLSEPMSCGHLGSCGALQRGREGGRVSREKSGDREGCG